MVWRVVAENDPREKDLHVGVTRGSSPGDVTTIVATRGKVLSHFQEPHSAVFAGSDDGFIAQYDDRLNFIKDWHAQEHGVTSLAVGRDEAATTWLYSASAFGEIKQWWPAALELIYQNTAEHPGSDSKGFTSAGGRRDSAVKELRWCEGSLYSGDDAGVICKWDCMLTLCWTTNVYSDVASLAVAAATPEKTTVLAANLISPQVVVGELRSRRKTEEGLEVAAMLDGKAPVAVSPTGEVVVCASAQDQGGLLVYTHQHRRGWTQVASLSAHTDQIASIAINSDTSQLCAAAWDGKVSIWCLESYKALADVKVAEYLNCICWGPSGEVYAGGAGASVVKLADVE